MMTNNDNSGNNWYAVLIVSISFAAFIAIYSIAIKIIELFMNISL